MFVIIVILIIFFKSPNYRYVFEDKIDFIRDSVIDGENVSSITSFLVICFIWLF